MLRYNGSERKIKKPRTNNIKENSSTLFAHK